MELLCDCKRKAIAEGLDYEEYDFRLEDLPDIKAYAEALVTSPEVLEKLTRFVTGYEREEGQEDLPWPCCVATRQAVGVASGEGGGVGEGGESMSSVIKKRLSSALSCSRLTSFRKRRFPCSSRPITTPLRCISSMLTCTVERGLSTASYSLRLRLSAV
jgi:hypothetical protein